MNKNHISNKIQRDVRFFAWLLGNGTLFAGEGFIDLIYEDTILQDLSMVETLFIIYANNLRREMSDSAVDASARCATWLANRCDPSYPLEPPLADWELEVGSPTANVFEAIKAFGGALSKRDVDQHILHNLDYVPDLFEGGSFMEAFTTVFISNVLTDDSGRVVNYPYALNRATQYIRAYLDPEYVVMPPFANWELEEPGD